jgi:hypothetical protein
MMVWVLDYEASGLNLGLSYPIEIGYTNGIIEREFLIFPESDWEWWDDESEKIHNIDKQELYIDGVSPKSICEIMNEDLGQNQVYCDGGIYDFYWNMVLFNAASMEPSFNLTNYDTSGMIRESIKHRALDDAKQIRNYILKKEGEILIG